MLINIEENALIKGIWVAFLKIILIKITVRKMIYWNVKLFDYMIFLWHFYSQRKIMKL